MYTITQHIKHNSLCSFNFLKARQQNAKIWGVIKTGSNQDGAGAQPITAPSGDQQYALLEHVYKTNFIDPASIQYIEAHGMYVIPGECM